MSQVAPTAAPPAPVPGAEDELRDRAHAAAETLRRLAPKSLEAHARLVHRDDAGERLVATRHDAEWIRVLESREEFPWVVVVAPPGYGKSTWFSIAYPSWEIGRTNGRVRYGLVSSAAGQANAFAQAVGESILTPSYQAAYPDVKPDKKRGWSRGHFFVTNCPEGANPTMLSSGLGGVSVLGKRFDVIGIDDPTTWEQARSETVMAGQRHFLRSTLMSRFPPGMGPPDGVGGRCVAVLTRWSERDLVPEFEDLGFAVVRMPALGYWDKHAHCPDCEELRDPDLITLLGDCEHCGSTKAPTVEYGEEALWPEKETARQLNAMRDEDELVFELVMQGNTKVIKGDFFEEDWWYHAEVPSREKFQRVVSFVDTASGRKRKKGDFFVIATLGKLKKEHWPEYGGRRYWWLDTYRKRIPTTKHVDACSTVYGRQDLRPNKLIVEDKNEGIALYDQLKEQKPWMNVGKVSPVTDKEYRATPMARSMRRAYFAFPPAAQAPWVRTAQLEMEEFPEGEHDDVVDAGSGAFNALTGGGVKLTVLG